MSLLLLRLLRRYFASPKTVSSESPDGIWTTPSPFVHSPIKALGGQSTERRIWRGGEKHRQDGQDAVLNSDTAVMQFVGQSWGVQWPMCVFLLSTSIRIVHVLCHHFIILLSVCSYADVSLSCFWFRLELIVHSATFAVHAVPWKRRGCRRQVLTCHCFKVLRYSVPEGWDPRAQGRPVNTEKSSKRKSWSWGWDDDKDAYVL